ncbi:hypothetical protein BDN72DRAFT_873178 [Pluteus cervinus]|uniref:Uncharacterized protein n=1 Tax=Pluteus cervinus TaxID=181527 RepID=A0ACD3A0J0_9AGAR|nr:hypothetical protein BDN72DRAFT_873178 [Pluteus cervinus]
MMESLARMLNFNFRRVGLHFNHKENRIRCFPHVVNISVKTGLKYLTKAMVGEDDADFVSPEDVQEDDEQVPHDDADIDYLEVLEDDIIAMIRKLVNSIRASDQRREALAEAIRSGNEANEYDPPIREVSLLRDVDTRWSSIYLMIDRFLELYPYYRELGDLLFTDLQLRVVYDIREYLFLFHNVQQTVSADKTPTLSVVLPVYEDLLTLLEKTQPLLRNLSHAFEASIRKLKEYLGYARETKAYPLAMCTSYVLFHIILGWPCTNTSQS